MKDLIYLLYDLYNMHTYKCPKTMKPILIESMKYEHENLWVAASSCTGGLVTGPIHRLKSLLHPVEQNVSGV